MSTLFGLEPDFTIQVPSSGNIAASWALEWLLLPHNGIRWHLRAMDNALLGISAYTAAQAITVQHLKRFFAWLEPLLELVHDHIDFEDSVVQPIFSFPDERGRRPSDASEMERFYDFEEEHRNIRSKIAQLRSLRKRLTQESGLLRLSIDVVRLGVVFLNRVLDYLREAEDVKPVLLHQRMTSADLRELIRTKRLFYEKSRLQQVSCTGFLPHDFDKSSSRAANSAASGNVQRYTRTLVMFMAWQTREEQRQTKALYLASCKSSAALSLSTVWYGHHCRLIDELCEQAERPKRTSLTSSFSRSLTGASSLAASLTSPAAALVAANLTGSTSAATLERLGSSGHPPLDVVGTKRLSFGPTRQVTGGLPALTPNPDSFETAAAAVPYNPEAGVDAALRDDSREGRGERNALLSGRQPSRGNAVFEELEVLQRERYVRLVEQGRIKEVDSTSTLESGERAGLEQMRMGKLEWALKKLGEEMDELPAASVPGATPQNQKREPEASRESSSCDELPERTPTYARGESFVEFEPSHPFSGYVEFLRIASDHFLLSPVTLSDSTSDTKTTRTTRTSTTSLAFWW